MAVSPVCSARNKTDEQSNRFVDIQSKKEPKGISDHFLLTGMAPDFLKKYICHFEGKQRRRGYFRIF
ncbi:MAG: Hypothetical protein C75L2_00410012 [Leptospirillum sp. Group II 'C75']|jgi:hypothetical protein|uniref:Uncharacterized protein n=1 Tax=Leptospirillum sp. Group II '5-way CG' TaxID=419541 RepID=B6ARV5_9BACT|nr:hypothetical protein ABH19_04080 [Leptospirillum sp. Group II 'CF-1']EAY56962.1 MAG: hypothetical protein UBAL2_80490242 [Leptospirillum rubarum]EDZ38201.1 MAG: Hypothetical protein CGL2_11284021 [Leptospirillum sp. Group II '5-way CG']EIJ75581.1 MAG: Hypothetical protein C75L2_00410012 [Leptospirillum sp. Group II 'C75']